jgi:hypothetical protein
MGQFVQFPGYRFAMGVNSICYFSVGRKIRNVGGSIPPLGTILIVFQLVIPWVAGGLSGIVSMAGDLRARAGFLGSGRSDQV